MNGKKLIAVIIIISLISLILTWIYGQKIIDDYDIDRAMEITTSSVAHIFTIFLSK